MILNVSNCTDIIQFFTPWFINRLNDGFFSVETEKVNNIYELSPKNFEMIVFQTKNPKPIIPYINMINDKGFKYFFIITVTPYDSEIEKNVDKSEIFSSIKELAARIGRDKIIWKYAPVILNSEIDRDFHYKYFNTLCKKLHKYTNSCIIDFVKPYNPPIHMNLYTPAINEDTQKTMIKDFSDIAKGWGIQIFAKHSKHPVKQVIKAQIKSQLGIEACDFEALDMGLPCTCKGLCEYCCCDGNQTFKKKKNHNPNSPLFIGEVDKAKKHAKRRVKPLT